MKYNVKILWQKHSAEVFTDNKYSRIHKWMFDGGTILRASSSPQVVPAPMSDASAVDPEEAFIASLSSCHMLFFLSIAASRKYTADTYKDHAEGIMSKNKEGETAITKITLRPEVIFSGMNIPSPEQTAKMHQLAHTKCYIANSVKSEIEIIPVKTKKSDL